METRCLQVFDTLFKMGVQEWIIIHYPEGVWAGNRQGARHFQSSLQLPKDYIVGSNGAGDALAAAILFGVHEGWLMEQSLKLGVCAAAASLSHVTCSGGMDYKASLALGDKLGYRE